jgi:hypothetical protein
MHRVATELIVGDEEYGFGVSPLSVCSLQMGICPSRLKVEIHTQILAVYKVNFIPFSGPFQEREIG